VGLFGESDAVAAFQKFAPLLFVVRLLRRSLLQGKQGESAEADSQGGAEGHPPTLAKLPFPARRAKYEKSGFGFPLFFWWCLFVPILAVYRYHREIPGDFLGGLNHGPFNLDKRAVAPACLNR